MIESPIPAFILKEFIEALPAIAFFAIGFNLIVLTTQLILDDIRRNSRPSWSRQC